VVFFEGSSDILFNYADALFGGACTSADQGASATVGVQVGSNSANQYGFNTASLSDGTALLWTLPSTNPAISVTPASQDFGSVPVGSYADRTFMVQNTGGGTLTGNASTSAPVSVVSGSPFSLAAGANQAVVVRFSPASEASFVGNVSFTSNAGDVSRGVTGVGTPSPPQISVTPTSLNFGSVGVGNSADQTFTVQNTGGGTLTGSAATTAPFSVVSGSPLSIDAGASNFVVVRFSPTATGTFTRTVTFTSNALTSPISQGVTGTGAQITVTSPKGGETWHINHNQSVKWSSKGVTGNVKIDLSRDGGINWEAVLLSTPNDGNQTVNLPAPATTQARIRVCHLSGTLCGASAANFKIQQ